MNFTPFVFKYKWIILFFIIFLSSILILKNCKDKIVEGKQIKKADSFMNDKVKKVILDNGFTILAFKNTQTPKVLLQIAYDVGSWVEKDDERGMAHLIEHMIFKGTAKLAEGDIDSIARKYGATFNAFTSQDMTSYYFEVDKNNWHPFVGILADCMQNARFDPEHLASEFKAVIQELRMHNDNAWRVMLTEAAKTIFPSNHPYHFPVIGFKQDLVAMKAQDLKKFYKKYYTPERATLFIVGDVDLDEAVGVAIKNFKDINAYNSKNVLINNKNSMFKLVPNTETNSICIYKDIKKNQLGFYWLIPGLRDGSEEVISVLEFILGHGEGSRLHKRLVEKEKVAASVACMGYQLMEAGLFFVLIEPLDGKSLDCKKILKEELDKIISEGLKEKELEKVISTKEHEFFQRLQDLSSFTYEWIKSFIATKNELDIFSKVKRLGEINSEKIKAFTKHFLDSFLMNQVEVLPLPKDKKEIWLRLKNESDELDKLILDSHPRNTPLEEPKFVKTLAAPKKLNFNFPKPSRQIKLDNGLTVLFYKNDYWPIFSLNCRFKQASYFSESKEGILLDFMMNFLMEGTGNFSKYDNVDFFEERGASYNFDVTGGYVSALTKNCKEILIHFKNVLTKPSFPLSELNKLKDIFVDLFQRRQDSQTDVGIRILKNLIYKNHPFEWTFEQAIDSIKNIDIEKLKELHSKYITPPNMVLSVVGNFDVDNLEMYIKDVFLPWEGKRYLVNEQEKGLCKVKKDVNEFMLRDQVFLLFGRPSSLNIYHKDLIPVKMLDFVAFGSLGSRLLQLREKSGLFYTAFGMFGAGAERTNGFDYVGSILNLENVEKTGKLIFDVIDNLGMNGIYEYELNAARQAYLKGIIDLTTSNESLADLFARLFSLELGFDYYDKVLNTVQTISLDEINKICKKYFDSKNMCRVTVGRMGNNN